MRSNSLWITPSDQWWIQARPKRLHATCPDIRFAGASVMSTEPDGMYVLMFPPTHADVVILEVCQSLQNLADKRSRYSPVTSTRVVRLPLNWLLEGITVQNGAKKPRWAASKAFPKAPAADHLLPIANLRALFVVKDEDYKKIAGNFPPAPHEFFCTNSSLASYKAQPMQAFLKRMSPAVHFYTAPKTK